VLADPELPACPESPALPAPAIVALPPEPACDALPPVPLGSPVVAALLLHADAAPAKTKIRREIAEWVRLILAADAESAQFPRSVSAVEAELLETSAHGVGDDQPCLRRARASCPKKCKDVA